MTAVDSRETAGATEPGEIRGLRRLHAALMPDYNRKASAYWYSVVALGMAALAYSAYQVALLPDAQIVQTVAGIVVATIAGMFPVRIPNMKFSIAAGDVFVFLMLLLLGPAAASLAAAGEAAVASGMTSKRWTSRIASPAMAAISMYGCAMLFTAVVPLRDSGTAGAGLLLGALVLMSVVYFSLSALLTMTVVCLKRDQPWRPFAMLGEVGWVGLSYAAGASIAGLLYLTTMQFGPSVLIVSTPIIALFLTTMHYYFNRQETEEAFRHARLEAAEREAAQSVRHMRELQESERRFHSAFTHASIGMALVSFDGRVLQTNDALRLLLGRDESELVGGDFRKFVCPEDIDALNVQVASLEEREVESFTSELRCSHREGHAVWVALHCSVFSESGSAAQSLILQVQDISARRRAETRLQHIAFSDSLTGLPNRNHFHETLGNAIERARRFSHHHFAVMFLDFDNFKLINDSMGHSAGDEFLVHVTRRIRESVRPADVVARLGGDEFAILCGDIDDEATAIDVAERLQHVMRTPLNIGGSDVSVSVSIGITFSRFGYETPGEVLRDADIAMYQAKNSGKARHVLFHAGFRARVSDRVLLERELRRGLDEGEVSAFYQPLFNLATGRLFGFEALARWNHPQRGMVKPDLFIPLAEEAGLIRPISALMLASACERLKSWQQMSAAFSDFVMHVNISRADLADRDLVGRVRNALANSGLRPQNLALELTENILMNTVDGALETLADLRFLGVRISIDDFGTGQSSLSHLSTLPFDNLKIDQSFVQKLRENSKETEIVRAIVSLGAALGKSVLAEGVETSAQVDQLLDLGCNLGQGFLLSQPIAPDQVELLLRDLEVRKSHHPGHEGERRRVSLH